MKIKITLDTGNAAFDPDPATEVARILAKYALRIENQGQPDECALIDYNGNTVGRVEIEREGGKNLCDGGEESNTPADGSGGRVAENHRKTQLDKMPEDNLEEDANQLYRDYHKQDKAEGSFLVFNETDGIPCAPQPFATREEAETFVKEWPSKWRERTGQTHYKTSRFEYIAPEDVLLTIKEDWADLVEGDE